MKENQLILSKIEMIAQEVISIITLEKRMTHDEVASNFKSSITYQFLSNIETEFFFKDVVELVEMWKQEQVMNEFLSDKIQTSNNRLLELSNQEIRNSLKKQSFLEEKPIEEVYYEFTHPNDKKTISKSKLKETTPYSH